MAMHKNAFTVDVETELSEEFSNQVDERAYTKYRAIEGALRLFMALDPSWQVALMGTEGGKVAKVIAEQASDISYRERMPVEERAHFEQAAKIAGYLLTHSPDMKALFNSAASAKLPALDKERFEALAKLLEASCKEMKGTPPKAPAKKN